MQHSRHMFTTCQTTTAQSSMTAMTVLFTNHPQQPCTALIIVCTAGNTSHVRNPWDKRLLTCQVSNCMLSTLSKAPDTTSLLHLL